MQELIRQFGVDWKLLLAQVANFLILMYLLKRFAYGPIIRMLNDRRTKIKEGMEASEAAQVRLSEANKTRDEIILKAEKESLVVVSLAEDLAKIQAKNVIQAAHIKSEEVLAQGTKHMEENARKQDEELRIHAQTFIKQGLVATIGQMNPTDRDEVLIKEALSSLKTL